MRILHILTLAITLIPTLLLAESAPIKILRVGDSITRYAASDNTLSQSLDAANIAYTMVGSQRVPVHNASGLMEGYNGMPIQFFTTHQKQFGLGDAINSDAIPIELAIERFQPDLILLMVGTNNLGSSEVPDIDVPRLRNYLATLLDLIHELAPDTHVIVATATPADNAYARWPNMANRNERTLAYNTMVVKPAVTSRAATGRNIALADAFAALNPETDLSDGVHPNDSGKAKINQVWFEAILKWLTSSQDKR